MAECSVNKSLVAGAESLKSLEVANSRRLLRLRGLVSDDAMLKLLKLRQLPRDESVEVSA